MNLPLKLKCQTNFSFKPNSQNQAKPIYVAQTQFPKTSTKTYKVEFKTLEGCKLGISRFPYFQYNAQGGAGKGTGTPLASSNEEEGLSKDDISVSFDTNTLYIPPLWSSTTRFLGLPLPPFLKIEIVPELFKGCINTQSGKVDLDFKAKFMFSVGGIYSAPALAVGTVLTSDESRGEIQSGRGRRLDKEGQCRLVGVARVEPIDDLFMNTFLQLPTECIAIMNAEISFSN